MLREKANSGSLVIHTVYASVFETVHADMSLNIDISCEELSNRDFV